jgi:hypothetical protein
VAEIAKHPDAFDQKAVTVTGTAAEVSSRISRRGNPYTTFRLTDQGESVKVFTFGTPAIKDGQRIEVYGVFRRVKQVGPYTFHDEIDAASVKATAGEPHAKQPVSPATPPAPSPNPPVARLRAAPSFSRAACQRAYEACVADCTGPVFDYDKGDYVSHTDFPNQCRDACASGGAACDDADRDERCDEFHSSCSGNCDSTVFDYRKSDYLMLTDADSKCEDACTSGESACQ